jgi:hypothetical protein
MSSDETPTAGDESPIVGPGGRQIFTYFGEMIPNQVFVKNESSTEQANFVMQGMDGTESPWKLFGVLRAGETVSYMVQWPTKAVFWNQGLFQTSINVYGNGIFAGEQARDS